MIRPVGERRECRRRRQHSQPESGPALVPAPRSAAPTRATRDAPRCRSPSARGSPRPARRAPPRSGSTRTPGARRASAEIRAVLVDRQGPGRHREQPRDPLDEPVRTGSPRLRGQPVAADGQPAACRRRRGSVSPTRPARTRSGSSDRHARGRAAPSTRRGPAEHRGRGRAGAHRESVTEPRCGAGWCVDATKRAWMLESGRRATPQGRRVDGAHRHARCGRRPRTGGFLGPQPDRNPVRRSLRLGGDGRGCPWAGDDDHAPGPGGPFRRSPGSRLDDARARHRERAASGSASGCPARRRRP